MTLAYRVTSAACPLTIDADIDGYAIWYCARGIRWELYEGREDCATGILNDHLIGDGLRWLAAGKCEDDEAQSVDFALARIRETCEPVTEDDTIRIKDVARLDLKPGDTLVITVPASASEQDAQYTRERALAILGDRLDEHHLLVMRDTATLSVIRQDES